MSIYVQHRDNIADDTNIQIPVLKIPLKNKNKNNKKLPIYMSSNQILTTNKKNTFKKNYNMGFINRSGVFQYSNIVENCGMSINKLADKT